MKRMKIIVVILAAVVLAGCGAVNKEIVKFDREMYKTNRETDQKLMATWSYNSGFIDGLGLKDRYKLPITTPEGVRALLEIGPSVLALSDLDALAGRPGDEDEDESMLPKLCVGKDNELVTCWNDLDFKLGQSRGTRIRLYMTGTVEAGQIVAPKLIKEIIEKSLPLVAGF